MSGPRVLYISYDGMGEPLGQGQVLAYLEPLAAEFQITLISFEKPGGDREGLEARMRRAGIDWRPLPYHDSVPVLSTLRDIVRGVRLARRAGHRSNPDLVHVRSYVAGCIALLAGARPPLIFDIRGFWADERVEGGMWRRGGMLDRLVRLVERALLRRASAVVTLTEASVPHLRGLQRGNPAPVKVIPTCADVDRFDQTAPRPDGPRAVWVGSIGPWYRFDLAIRLARAMDVPMHVLTRQTEAAESAIEGPGVVKEVPAHAVAGELCEGDIGICFYTEGVSALARAPTRAAEYLAAGMPIAITPALGDLPDLVAREHVGVVASSNGESLDEVAQRLLALSSDPAVRRRCRAIARERFDLGIGVRAYRELYAEILDSQPERQDARSR
jgi:glycosyltransferase involved in cell wall biosynthesis